MSNSEAGKKASILHIGHRNTVYFLGVSSERSGAVDSSLFIFFAHYFASSLMRFYTSKVLRCDYILTAATCCLKPIGSETADSVLAFCGLEPALRVFSEAP